MTPKSSLLSFALLAVPALASQLPDACGKPETKFDVKAEKTSALVGQPAGGQAQIVFLQEENYKISPFSNATVRFGADGAWAGATKGRSYFVMAVEPGVHHVCANWQSAFSTLNKNADALSFTAEPGKTYFFSAAVTVESREVTTFSFSELNDDQGKYRVKLAKLSTFKIK